jgi:hypothetical protein
MSTSKKKSLKYSTSNKYSHKHSSTDKSTYKLDSKWLNNVIMGKNLIEIAVRTKKWSTLIKLIRNNKDDWKNIINSSGNDTLLQIFRAQKFKLISLIENIVPFQWTFEHLSYLVASPPNICTTDYKTTIILKNDIAKLYLKIYRNMIKNLDINNTTVWSDYIIKNEDNNNNMYLNFEIPLLGYALYYKNLYVMYDLVSRPEYKLGQYVMKFNNKENFIYTMINEIIGMSYETSMNHVKSYSDIYLQIIKKMFDRQNVNWNFKIELNYNETYNLLTFLYFVYIPSSYSDTNSTMLLEICKEVIKHIDPNKPDASGNYPLDISIYNDNPSAYPFIKLLIENGAYKYNLEDTIEENRDIIRNNIDFTIKKYDTYQNNMINSYKNIIKYIKSNNIIDNLIKSRFDAEQIKILYKMIDFDSKNIDTWIFYVHNNINIIISLCKYLTYKLLPNNKLIEYRDYFSLNKSDIKILKDILLFYSSVNGLKYVEHFNSKNTETYINHISIYNLYPIVYKFPVIYEISKKIMKLYPKNSYVITIGESLDKILFLQSLIEKNEMKQNNTYISLPFSDSIDINENPETLKLSQKYCKYLYKLNLHPEQIVNQNKNIVIADFAATGKGIFSFVNMYFNFCTKTWSKFKINKLKKKAKVVATTSWQNNLEENLKNISIKLEKITLPYQILSYFYDISNYRCMKEFPTSKWDELDNINFESKKKYDINEVNGCNLIRFYIINAYHNYLAQNKKTIKNTHNITKLSSKIPEHKYKHH